MKMTCFYGCISRAQTCLNSDVHKLCKNADLSANSLSNVILKMYLKNSLKSTPNVYTFNVKEVRK